MEEAEGRGDCRDLTVATWGYNQKRGWTTGKTWTQKGALKRSGELNTGLKVDWNWVLINEKNAKV